MSEHIHLAAIYFMLQSVSESHTQSKHVWNCEHTHLAANVLLQSFSGSHTQVKCVWAHIFGRQRIGAIF